MSKGFHQWLSDDSSIPSNNRDFLHQCILIFKIPPDMGRSVYRASNLSGLNHSARRRVKLDHLEDDYPVNI